MTPEKQKSDSLILKLNHLIFWWYYIKQSEHFRGYTFFKSVSLLRQNYEWLADVHKESVKEKLALIMECDRLRSELNNYRMGQAAKPEQITQLNKMFGTKFTKPTDN